MKNESERKKEIKQVFQSYLIRGPLVLLILFLSMNLSASGDGPDC